MIMFRLLSLLVDAHHANMCCVQNAVLILFVYIYLWPRLSEYIRIYHILVVDKAKILPCNKTLSFV